jgi:hypothetical protein
MREYRTDTARARSFDDALARSWASDETAAGQVMMDPQVVAVVERLRPIAREVGLTDAKINALMRKGSGDAHAASVANATATVSQELLPPLARWLGVDEIKISGVAGEVSVHPTLRNGRVVCKVVAGPAATVGDVLEHRGTVERLKRHNGFRGKLRATLDYRANPYQVFTGAYEAFEELRKYEAMIRGRMIYLISLVGHGGAAGMAAASRLENEILVMEGELSYWRGVLEDVKRTGDPRPARGLIEAKDIGKVTAEAVAAGYPELPSERYYYRRWPGGGPEGQVFQVVRVDASGPDVKRQVRRYGSGWRLEEAEGTGKVPRAFEAALSNDQVLAGILAESESVRLYVAVLTDPHGIALEPSSVRARMLEVINRVRTPRGATADQVAAGARRVDEEHLRPALKAEFREAFFACAAREPMAAARMARFRDITKHLNPGDHSSLMEDFLARREPRAVQRVTVKQADHPLLDLTAKERHIDRVMLDDGTVVEVKSSKGKLSADERAQLDDYKEMATAGITIQVAGQSVMIKRVMYEFTEPEGVLANLTTINKDMLQRRISVKIYNKSGHERTLKDKADLVGIVEWLAE